MDEAYHEEVIDAKRSPHRGKRAAHLADWAGDLAAAEARVETLVANVACQAEAEMGLKAAYTR